MEHRYSLRFESGERRGESIPIPATGITVGRKPGNTLQILDNSVSGSHAELIVESDGVLLRDTGSTNGTRVGTQRVLEQRLEHGDTVLFGNVRVSFRDAQASNPDASDGVEIEGLDEPSPAMSPVSPTVVATAPDGLVRVSAEVLAKSKKRSFSGAVVVAVLALVGVGLWWFFNRSSGGNGPANRSIEVVAGNLIADGFSFEGDDASWSAADGSPAAFVHTAASRRSGGSGLEADLEADQWALHRSSPVRAASGRVLEVRGYLRTKGEVQARVGIEFSNPPGATTDAPAPVIAWAAPVTGASQFNAAEVKVTVPPGWSQARAVILGRSIASTGGEVDADDVSLVDVGEAAAPAALVGGAALYTMGEPPVAAQLTQADRVLVSGIAYTRADDPLAFDARELSVRATAPRLSIEPRGAGATVLVMRAEEILAHARVATIGKDGYRTHALDFERAGVDTLLFGSGSDLVRVQLAGPATVRGVGEGGAARLTVTPAQNIEIQLDFAPERKEAGNVAYAARGAEQKGDLGGAIAQWQALLDGFPYEDALVNEAEAARTRLVQKGLEDLRAVQHEVERARFFRLADLYRKCRDNALAVANRYHNSEVESEAKKLATSVDADIATLEVDQNKLERARMRGILATLEAQKAQALALEVRTYLTEKLGEGK